MTKIQEIEKSISDLFNKGSEILSNTDLHTNHLKLNLEYESWYTKCYAVIEQIVPERLQDFKHAYRIDKRKSVDIDTYRIHDFLHGMSIKDFYGQDKFDARSVFLAHFINQISILRSAHESIGSVLRDIKGVLKAEMYDNELFIAKELLKNNHVRSAGVICGVIIEGHFKSVTSRRSIKLRMKNPTIADYNDELKNSGVYDIPMWRLVQRLSDIRNYCAHKKEREPKKDEVEDLVNGTDKIIKEIF